MRCNCSLNDRPCAACIIEAKDADIAVLSANNKEMGIERFELINEIGRLRAVLKECHDNVYRQKELAALVDFYYHELFVEDK